MFAFTGRIILNCIGSLFYFIFTYIRMVFKRMRGTPIVVSQLISIVMILLPVWLYMMLPLRVTICIYCVVAMLYGIKSAYDKESDYEFMYHIKKSNDRRAALEQALAEQNASSPSETPVDSEEDDKGSDKEEANEESLPSTPAEENAQGTFPTWEWNPPELLPIPPNPLENRSTVPISPAQTEPEPQAEFCPYCGKRLKQDAAFCVYCGQKVIDL